MALGFVLFCVFNPSPSPVTPVGGIRPLRSLLLDNPRVPGARILHPEAHGAPGARHPLPQDRSPTFSHFPQPSWRCTRISSCTRAGSIGTRRWPRGRGRSTRGTGPIPLKSLGRWKGPGRSPCSGQGGEGGCRVRQGPQVPRVCSAQPLQRGVGWRGRFQQLSSCSPWLYLPVFCGPAGKCQD